MNSLYTLALRQSSSLSSDLDQLSRQYSTASASSSSALHGQINSSFVAFDRTIQDYDQMAKREIVDQKRDKALERVERFKQDYSSLRKQYEQIKTQGTSKRVNLERSELLNGVPQASTSSVSSGHAYSSSTSGPSARTTSRPSAPPPNGSDSTFVNFAPSSSSSSSNPSYPSNSSSNNYGYDPRTNHALKEHDFFSSTTSTLDGYLAQGQAVLDNLTNQREVMKGTKKRLLNAANTLGLSRETIQFIERRTKGDWYILVGGGAFTLICFGLILKYFG
ncbi:Bos1p [Sporobolomyces koalae]|uniref:Bos1p n=1 Tax=Sporobolomyces koalae TaxID=500713 RepID=UPI00317B89E6